MKAICKLVILFFILAAIPTSLSATHIIGGEISYRCLGNGSYEISLRVFRDCFNGQPNFDDPAYIAIFDMDDVLVDSLEIPVTSVDDTLRPQLEDTCLSIPPNVCVHTTFYLDTIQLSASSNGYKFYYQRCCRNRTIQNIEIPDSIGATFTLEITKAALQECSDGPVYNDWPPIYICANKPLIFDHSASDADGDSLVYKLCAPLDGSNTTNSFTSKPLPSQQSLPIPVVWKPPFGLDNLLGGVPLRIDSLTGLMTATPTLQGQFVVGVCMEEYRDGVLLSTARRDFQYNVGICGEPSSAFFTPDTICGKTVTFQNQSTAVTTSNWYFNGFNDTLVSLDRNPVFEFPEFGNYEVTLVINEGSACSDTFSRRVELAPNSILANFQPDSTPICQDSVVLSASNLTTDTLGNIIGYEWKLFRGSTNNLIFSSERDSFSQVLKNIDDVIFLRLIAKNDRNCIDSTIAPINVRTWNNPPTDTTIQICQSQRVTLNQGGNPNYRYEWWPSQFLNDSTAVSPQVSGLMDTTVFNVTVTDSFSTGVCVRVHQVTVNVGTQRGATVSPPFTVCNMDSVTLKVNSKAPNSKFIWILLSSAEDTLGRLDSLNIEPPPASTSETYLVIVDQQDGCTSGYPINVCNKEIAFDTNISNACIGDTIVITLDLLGLTKTDTSLQLNWTTDSDIEIDSNGTVVYLMPDSSNTLYLEAVNSAGCILKDTLEVRPNLPQPTAITGDTVICNANSTDLMAEAATGSIISWSESTDFSMAFDTAQSINYRINPGQTKRVFILVDQQDGCVLLDSIDLISSFINVVLPDTVFRCSLDSIVLIPELTNTGQQTTYDWDSDDIIILDTAASTQTILPTSDIEYSLTVSNEQACEASDTAFITFSGQFIIGDAEAQPADIEFGESSQLNATSNVNDATYEWQADSTLSNLNIADPLASPLVSTTYYVTITRDGCSTTDSVEVRVTDPPCIDPYVFLPNVFTPNGDKLNDVLQVYGEHIDESYFVIYNRWGEKIFESNSKNEVWDGTYKGKELSEDVYAYYLRVRCVGGETWQQKGNVTLLR